MSSMASQITTLTIVYSTVYSGADQRKHQSSASLAFVRGIHRWPVNSPHKGPVTWKNASISWRHHEFASPRVSTWRTAIESACVLVTSSASNTPTKTSRVWFRTNNPMNQVQLGSTRISWVDSSMRRSGTCQSGHRNRWPLLVSSVYLRWSQW